MQRVWIALSIIAMTLSIVSDVSSAFRTFSDEFVHLLSHSLLHHLSLSVHALLPLPSPLPLLCSAPILPPLIPCVRETLHLVL
ncbi:hypothetical protein B0H12DRAFT_1174257, partial [Mycena haematopus]